MKSVNKIVANILSSYEKAGIAQQQHFEHPHSLIYQTSFCAVHFAAVCLVLSSGSRLFSLAAESSLLALSFQMERKTSASQVSDLQSFIHTLQPIRAK